MRISFSESIHLLQRGDVVAVPTETVYGLAASLDSETAIDSIFTLKNRPLTNPLIIHVANLDQIEKFVVDYPPSFDLLAHHFWPGSLTCILSVNRHVSSKICAGLPTAAFRIPALELTRSLLTATGPLVMPSANLSGRPSATRPEHIEEDFGQNFPILDGGICEKGVESTILLYQKGEWVIVRLGALQSELFAPVLGYIPRYVQKSNEVQPICPGQHFRHYAPKAHLYLGNVSDLAVSPFILGFRERNYPQGKKVILLGSVNNEREVAENLYQALRQLDHEKASHVWVDMDFPRDGLWQTIAERLTRAGERYSHLNFI